MKLFGFYDPHDALPMQERWAAQSPAWIELIPVGTAQPEELSEPVDGLKEMADEVMSRLGLNEPPYAFFGYRSGARLALAVAGKLQKSGLPVPGHLLLAGANPPHVGAAGTGALHGEWETVPSRFGVIAGRQDREVLPERLSEWSRYTQGSCHIHSVPGGPAVWTTQPEGLIRSCLLILEREYARRA